MLDLNDLDAFSRRWAGALFARYPDFQKHATVEHGTLSVNVPSPVAGRSLWITSAYGGIMVGFVPTAWHEHFEAEDRGIAEDQSFAEALAAVDEVITEKIAI